MVELGGGAIFHLLMEDLVVVVALMAIPVAVAVVAVILEVVPAVMQVLVSAVAAVHSFMKMQSCLMRNLASMMATEELQSLEFWINPKVTEPTNLLRSGDSLRLILVGWGMS